MRLQNSLGSRKSELSGANAPNISRNSQKTRHRMRSATANANANANTSNRDAFGVFRSAKQISTFCTKSAKLKFLVPNRPN
jgi:hypothetical protein